MERISVFVTKKAPKAGMTGVFSVFSFASISKTALNDPLNISTIPVLWDDLAGRQINLVSYPSSNFFTTGRPNSGSAEKNAETLCEYIQLCSRIYFIYGEPVVAAICLYL